MSYFKNKSTTKLGELGEEMVLNEFCRAKGYFPFRPSIDNTSHPIDGICMDPKTGKKFNIDIKTKSSRIYYPDTGCDTADIKKYLEYADPTYLLFVDPKSGNVYGNWLQKLKKNMVVDGKLTFLQLKDMTEYRKLTQDEILQLKNYENSNY